MQIYKAEWVIPVTSPPLRMGAVAVDDGKIVYVGDSFHAPTGEVFDLGPSILLPGLINTHTHLELTAMRGYLEALEFPDWIDRLRHARNTVLIGDALHDSSVLGIAEGLERGITTFADTSSSGAPLKAMLEMGVRGIMYLETFGPDPSHAPAAIGELQGRLLELRQVLSESDSCLSPLVTLGVSPHAPYTVSDDLYVAAAELAAELDMPIAVHISESIHEDDYVKSGEGLFADRLRARGITVDKRGVSPVEMLSRLGVMTSRTLLIHAVQLDEDDIEIVAAHGCGVAHCPVSNAKLGHGIAPVTNLLAKGVRVGVGSDSVASNNKMDMLEEVRIASLFQSVADRKTHSLTTQQALELLTIGGARALGIDAAVGSLQVGKDADLAAFSLDSLRARPCYSDPVTTLIYSMAGAPSVFTAVRGRHLVEDGKLRYPMDTTSESVNFIGRALAAV